jgi:hypothetical protein
MKRLRRILIVIISISGFWLLTSVDSFAGNKPSNPQTSSSRTYNEATGELTTTTKASTTNKDGSISTTTQTCTNGQCTTTNSTESGSGNSKGGDGGGGKCTAFSIEAMNECSGGMGIGQGIAMAKQLKTESIVATNQLELCKKQKKQAEAARSGANIVGVACLAAYSGCMAFCRGSSNDVARFQCTQAFMNAGGAFMNSKLQATQAIAEADRCIQEYSEKNCDTGTKKDDNPACIEAFCAKHDKEPINNALCNKCNRVGGNDLKDCPQYCVYHSTDTATCNVALSPTGGGTQMPSLAGDKASPSDLPPPPDSVTPPDFGDGDIKDGPFAGQQNSGSSGKFDANDTPGGGGGLGGGGAGYPGGAAQGQGKDPGQYNKDIDHGVNGGGGGGGYSVGGGGVEGGGGGGMGKDGNPIDLSKFLPGGENDPSKRDPAGAGELAAQGITGANDISNFEKITRMMNKKKPGMKQ